MSHVRFQYVFYTLMGLSAVVAFIVPAQTAEHYQPRVEILFAPVARPLGAIARSFTARTSPPRFNDNRTSQEVLSENDSLRNEVMQLTARVAELTRQANELGKLSGTLKDVCRVTRVVGADSGNRESISISGSSLDGISADMYVLCTDGLVGQVARAGTLGSQVRLITDPAFRIKVNFLRFEKEFPVRLPVGSVVVQGTGNGRMKVTLKLEDIGLDPNLKPLDPAVGAIVREGDFVQINDNECPGPIQGLRVGKVAQVVQLKERLYAEIQIEPTINLKRVGEVMVMTKDR